MLSLTFVVEEKSLIVWLYLQPGFFSLVWSVQILLMLILHHHLILIVHKDHSIVQLFYLLKTTPQISEQRYHLALQILLDDPLKQNVV